jgi:hypothetical protein
VLPEVEGLMKELEAAQGEVCTHDFHHTEWRQRDNEGDGRHEVGEGMMRRACALAQVMELSTQAVTMRQDKQTLLARLDAVVMALQVGRTRMVGDGNGGFGHS